MLCERCKIREANIQYTEIVNGVRKEHNFCAQCARELDFGPYSAIFDSEFPLGKLLSGLLGLQEGEDEKASCQVTCPTCGLSYEEFVKNSCFGCPDCYGVFDLLISDNIKQLQGNDSHKGKHPRHQKIRQERPDISSFSGEEPTAGLFEKTGSVEEELQILEARREEAVRREDYETAALCRDKIKALKEGLGA